MNTKTEYLPLNLFTHFKELTKIYMLHTYTKMSSPKNGHFLMADKLEEIVFVNQRLGELAGRVFEGCKSIKTILLDNDEINTLDEDTFAGLTTLETLSISSNEITALPLKTFSTLSTLKILDLSSNMISTLPKSAFNSNRHLERIKLDRNRFLNVPPVQIAEETYYDFTDSICIDRAFDKTSTLNEYTSTKCHIEDLSPFDLVEAYRKQNEINQICGDKNVVVNLETHLKSLERTKEEKMTQRENLEHEIMKTKIYKNSLC